MAKHLYIANTSSLDGEAMTVHYVPRRDTQRAVRIAAGEQLEISTYEDGDDVPIRIIFEDDGDPVPFPGGLTPTATLNLAAANTMDYMAAKAQMNLDSSYRFTFGSGSNDDRFNPSASPAVGDLTAALNRRLTIAPILNRVRLHSSDEITINQPATHELSFQDYAASSGHIYVIGEISGGVGYLCASMASHTDGGFADTIGSSFWRSRDTAGSKSAFPHARLASQDWRSGIPVSVTDMAAFTAMNSQISTWFASGQDVIIGFARNSDWLPLGTS